MRSRYFSLHWRMKRIISGSFERGTTPSWVMKLGLRRPMAPNARLRHFQRSARSYTEHSFATNHYAAQIETLDVFAAVRLRAEPDELAIGQNHFEAEDVIGGDPVFERVRPARIGGDVAADGAGGLAGRVRCKK